MVAQAEETEAEETETVEETREMEEAPREAAGEDTVEVGGKARQTGMAHAAVAN